MMRTDIEAIEADLQKLRGSNEILDHTLGLIERGIVSREHGYAALVRVLVQGLNRISESPEKSKDVQ